MDSKRVIKLAGDDCCTGCGSCKAKCPQGAISFQEDEEGFPSPVIDNDICIRCGLCELSCPDLSLKLTNIVKGVYAAQLKDRVALLDSTSGGLFTAFSREAFRQGGVVYGCKWNEDCNAVFQKAETEVEILPMRGSKYVWSWAGDAFPEIKTCLNEGRFVLFTGLPCQVAGLRRFLVKDYPNLICIEMFCGGAPSPMAMRAYFSTITRDISFEQLNYKFRDKHKYGVGVNVSYQGKKKRINQSWVGNSWYWSFYNKLFHRRSCFHCRYRYINRVGDITIGDFWSVKKYHPELDIKAGVSSVLINTDKGADFFRTVEDQLIVVQSKLEYVADYQNLTITDEKVEFQMVPYRKELFELLRKKGWTAVEHKDLYSPHRVILLLKSTKLGSVARRLKKKTLG